MARLGKSDSWSIQDPVLNTCFAMLAYINCDRKCTYKYKKLIVDSLNESTIV